MEYKKEEKPTYKLHMIKTNKFKTLVFKLIFRKEITKEEISYRNLLIDNLLYSSKKYPTKKDVAKKKQDLYGADIVANNNRVGNHILSEFTLSMLNPKYTEDGMLEESLEFFCNTIFMPNIIDDGFYKDYFDTIKENNITTIKQEEDNATFVSQRQFKRTIDKDSPISLDMNGDIEIISNITKESLYEYYKEKFFKSIIDLYVIGDFDFYDMQKKIDEYFHFHTLITEKKPLQLQYKVKRKKELYVSDNSKFHQSKLLISGYFKDITNKERKYVSTILSVILGNSPESHLFKIVREKNSYAYNISANYYKTDDIFIIGAGISKGNYKNVIKLIKKILEDIKNGDIKDEELENAKELIITLLKDIFEYPSSIIDFYFNMELLDHDNLDTQIDIFNKITKEEVINLANKLKLDVFYLLKETEEKDEEIRDK